MPPRSSTLLDIGAAAFFGKHVLAGAAAEVVHEAVEVHVVELRATVYVGKPNRPIR